MKFVTFLFVPVFVFANLMVFKSVVAQLGIISSTATLSQNRSYPVSTSLKDLIFFAGGVMANGTSSDQVDICNVTSGNWTTATLSIARYGIGAASSGNFAFFAGGFTGPLLSPKTYSQVDIYNILNGSWNTATLSQPRGGLAAASVGNLVLFAGGATNTTSTDATVDIYNVATGSWSTATLSIPRILLSGTSISNQLAIFAGGATVEFGGPYMTAAVDIYDYSTGNWVTGTLSQRRAFMSVASSYNLALFGGGEIDVTTAAPSNVVDIFNATSQQFTTTTLSQARGGLAATAVGEYVAFGGGTLSNGTDVSLVEVYNTVNVTWFTLTLSQPRTLLAAISLENKMYFGGGQFGNVSTNIVDIFDFSAAPQTPIPPLAFTFLSSPINFNTSSKAQSPNSVALLAGVLSAAAALIIAVTILLIVLLLKKRKNKKLKSERKTEKSPNDKRNVETFILESVTDNIKRKETISTTMPSYRSETETLKQLSPGQIPLNELKIGRVIGNGNYGRVCEGKWKKYRVALKFCQNKGQMDEFMREANLMISLPPHPNVVRMYGVSIDGTQPIIVMEYCAGGSLDKLLFDTEELISDEQKIRWVHEIALGMCHLHKHNIAHRDLAARNILLSNSEPSNAHLKISDFGMSRVLQQDLAETTNVYGPIRWMAPESIGKHVYSKKSDMWMFGVVIWGPVRYLHAVSLDRPSYEGRTKAVLGVKVDNLHSNAAR